MLGTRVHAMSTVLSVCHSTCAFPPSLPQWLQGGGYDFSFMWQQCSGRMGVMTSDSSVNCGTIRVVRMTVVEVTSDDDDEPFVESNSPQPSTWVIPVDTVPKILMDDTPVITTAYYPQDSPILAVLPPEFW